MSVGADDANCKAFLEPDFNSLLQMTLKDMVRSDRNDKYVRAVNAVLGLLAEHYEVAQHLLARLEEEAVNGGADDMGCRLHAMETHGRTYIIRQATREIAKQLIGDRYWERSDKGNDGSVGS